MLGSVGSDCGLHCSSRPTEPQEQNPDRNGALAAVLAALPELPLPHLCGRATFPPPDLPQERLQRALGAFWGVGGGAAPKRLGLQWAHSGSTVGPH